MAGIYLHIPFCKKACHYCNFHFSTNLSLKDKMIHAMVQEIHLRSHILTGMTVETIYFGGGTPSILKEEDIQLLLNAIKNKISKEKLKLIEVTIEANPDDITLEKITTWKKMGINRVSLGIQSFSDQELRYMNRSHDHSQSLQSIELLRSMGISLSVDLIYGGPYTDDATLLQAVDTILSYEIPHISAYNLTIEEGTAMGNWLQKGKIQPVDDIRSARQFELIIQRLAESGYHHYEISNFALPDAYAIHNTNYWMGQPYLGIGPSAHSYDGERLRSWNISNNALYIKHIEEGTPFVTEEKLSETELVNEYLMIRLRTMWGFEKKDLLLRFPTYGDSILSSIARDPLTKFFKDEDGYLKLNATGKPLADRIISELFIV